MTAALFDPADRAFAAALSRMAYGNPFLPERMEGERAALGQDFTELEAVWSVRAGVEVQNPNLAKLGQRAEALATKLQERLARGSKAAGDDQALYEDLVLYLLYFRYEDGFWDLVAKGSDGKTAGRVGFFGDFLRDADHFFRVDGARRATSFDAPHQFACLFQVRRAFHHTFWTIIGGSMPAARLRAAVWQSIFTHDMRRYRRSLYNQMNDITTLITGPSGTGKELVARAIGLSRYIPFDADKHTFREDFAGSFYALNLSALSPTLIESELFGHRRGAFTGALEDRAGWLEVCRPLGTVFLDEIGDLDPAIQVKLLRVLQTRTFQRLGDTRDHHFHGKIIAATNRDLAAEMHAGRFREDFYYRLCSDMISTPTLRDQLHESPGELRNLVTFLATRIAGDDEAEALTDEVVTWIDSHLGPNYAWPGNVRELEQCVRNVLIRKEYRAQPARPTDARQALVESVLAGSLTADELLGRYCTLVYAQTGSYQETARRLLLDRRTVKAKVDPTLLQALKTGAT